MAKLDMKNIKKSEPKTEPQEQQINGETGVVEPTAEVSVDTSNSEQISELTNSEQAETGQPPVELTDNTSEHSDDTNKTASEEPKAEPQEQQNNGSKVVVVYVGGGTWRDEKGLAWANTDKGDIKHSRQYSKDDYDQRKDLQFMVKYKSMTATIVE